MFVVRRKVCAECSYRMKTTDVYKRFTRFCGGSSRYVIIGRVESCCTEGSVTVKQIITFCCGGALWFIAAVEKLVENES